MTRNYKILKINTKDFCLDFSHLEYYNFNRNSNLQKIYFGWCDTPFGKALLMCNEKALCGLALASELGKKNVLKDMMKRWPDTTFHENFAIIKEYSKVIFSGTGELIVELFGTSFQVKVWEELLKIPSGQTKSYSEIANKIGFPKATRAVATAVGRNPIGWLIPCHRAIRKSGGLGGYHWGMSIKEKMLNYEKIDI